MTAPVGPLWHVTLNAAGEPMAGSGLQRALRRLCAQDPGNMAARYGRDWVEVQFWDEGDLGEVASAALALWAQARGVAGLPDWPLAAIEVHDRGRWRQRQGQVSSSIAPGSVELRT